MTNHTDEDFPTMLSSLNSAIVRRIASWTSTPKGLQQALNIWPPLLGSGIYISRIADDWSFGRLNLLLNPVNRNMHGAAYGGSLYSMADVMFGTLVMKRLGPEYEAWTRTGNFQFISPGRNKARMDILVPDDLVALAKDEIERDGYCNLPSSATITNRDGSLVGIAQQDLHVRIRGTKRRPGGPEGPMIPRGLTLDSLTTAVLWRCFSDDPEKITHTLSAFRRMAEPDEKAERACRMAIEEGGMTREKLLEMKIPEKYLP